MENNILVITDDENGRIVNVLLKRKINPIIRRSIPSALQLMRHLKFRGIIVEDEHKNLDTLEFILNVRDLNTEIPIFISNKYQKHNVIKKIQNLGMIEIFDETDNKIENKLQSILTK